MKALRTPTISLFAFVALVSVARGAEKSVPVDFNSEIRPIFAQHCIACHGGVKQAGDLSFVYRDRVFAGGESGLPTVVPGSPDESYLIDRITDSDPDLRMPPADHGPPLSAAEIETLRRWIAEGANWKLSWAFVAPKDPQLPAVQQENWCLKPLDKFVLSKLEELGLQPSREAERAEWLRRASFDIIGLPPTEQEVQEFLNDAGSDAHERVVDRLLASTHFGERWASVWLDLARYADTTGYERDPHRDIWPYRDWVIRAFNSDMPFDQFAIRQLAGDLMENATLDDYLATAFHRNTQTNTEGGTDDEEFRTAAVIDRVNTTWQVWQATTFGCVQCHSHPYEPIEHEEYYKFLSIFNNTADADIDEDLPLVDYPTNPSDYPRVAEIFAARTKLHRLLYETLIPLAQNEQLWQSLPIDKANSTGGAKLGIEQMQSDKDRLQTEVHVKNTPATNAVFTLEAPIPNGFKQISALRIDAMLNDPEAAQKLPEMGFVLSQLKATILPAEGGEPIELRFSHAFSDEMNPLLDPADSLNDNDRGWASYSRQWHPHYAVFMLDKSVAIPPRSRIRLELIQNRTTSGEKALVLNRSSYSVSSSDAWIDRQQDSAILQAKRELKKFEKQLRKIPSISVPIVAELPREGQRATFIFTRGLWLDKGKPVQPGTPAILPPLNPKDDIDRLAIARWLVAKENPLTARVMVNRIWAQLFGTGLVETAEDFGTSGTLPSHPELLDHLAIKFRDDFAWSVKQIIREIALSSTYRQQAKTLPTHLEADPENRLFTRGPRQRLTAEMVRDQAIMLSGNFSSKMYGPPVMPPQPEGVWRSVYSDAKWKAAEGDNRYRRAIYTYWKRTSGYPSMLTFDVPSRDVCTARRIATNTPLQALVTLNDEAFVECALGFAKEMLAQGESEEERLSWAYRRATGREPSNANLETLQELLSKSSDYYDSNSAEVEELGVTAELAPYLVVASTIMNLDEALTK